MSLKRLRSATDNHCRQIWEDEKGLDGIAEWGRSGCYFLVLIGSNTQRIRGDCFTPMQGFDPFLTAQVLKKNRAKQGWDVMEIEKFSSTSLTCHVIANVMTSLQSRGTDIWV